MTNETVYGNGNGVTTVRYRPRTVDILSFAYTVGYFISLWFAFYKPFPSENRDVLNVLLGILSMVMVKIVEAYFNKDTANSATSTAIRALKSDPTLSAELDHNEVSPPATTFKKELLP